MGHHPRTEQLKTQLHTKFSEFTKAEASGDRGDTVDAIVRLTDDLLQEDKEIPARQEAQRRAAAQRQHAQRVAAAKQQLARTFPVVLTAAGVCAAAGLAAIATVIWGNTPHAAITGGVISLILGGSLVLVSSVEEHPKAPRGKEVPQPSQRWLISVCAAASAVAFLALAWGFTGGFFGWVALLITGLPAFALSWFEIGESTQSQQTSRASSS